VIKCNLLKPAMMIKTERNRKTKADERRPESPLESLISPTFDLRMTAA